MDYTKIPRLTSSQLKREIAKIDKEFEELMDEMILAGRGHEKPSVTLSKAEREDPDELTSRWAINFYRGSALRKERDARIAFNNTTHPMP
jgi:hypothetical protein